MGEGSPVGPRPRPRADRLSDAGRRSDGSEVGTLAIEEGSVLLPEPFQTLLTDSVGEPDSEPAPRGHAAPVEVTEVSRVPRTAADQHVDRPSLPAPVMTAPDPVRVAIDPFAGTDCNTCASSLQQWDRALATSGHGNPRTRGENLGKPFACLGVGVAIPPAVLGHRRAPGPRRGRAANVAENGMNLSAGGR